MLKVFQFVNSNTAETGLASVVTIHQKCTTIYCDTLAPYRDTYHDIWRYASIVFVIRFTIYCFVNHIYECIFFLPSNILIFAMTLKSSLLSAMITFDSLSLKDWIIITVKRLYFPGWMCESNIFLELNTLTTKPLIEQKLQEFYFCKRGQNIA